MSDGELKPGTALFLRGFKDHPNEDCVLTFPAPKEKGRYHLAIWLGTWAEGENLASERLNAMGWFYDPAAKDASAKRIRDTAPGLLEALREACAWFDRALPVTDDSTDFLNEGGWDDLAAVAQKCADAIEKAVRAKGEEE